LEQLFVKRFEGETEVEIDVVVDVSASMGIEDGAKHRISRLLSASVAFAWAGQGRTIQVFGLGAELQPLGQRVRGEKQRTDLLKRLERMEVFSGRFAVRAMVPLLTAASRHARMVIVISDFLDEPCEIPFLMGARRAGTEVVFAGVTCRQERQPSLSSLSKLLDVESNDTLTISLNEGLLSRYQRIFDDSRAEMARVATAHGGYFVDLAAEDTFDVSFLKLVKRLQR